MPSQGLAINTSLSRSDKQIEEPSLDLEENIFKLILVCCVIFPQESLLSALLLAFAGAVIFEALNKGLACLQ